MLKDTFKFIFRRDLLNLKKEIESYRKEEILWFSDHRIANSGGNLCLHLVGNLNAFIGAGLGKTGYVRKRDLEFSTKHIPKAELIRKIEEVIEVVEKGLDTITEADRGKDFPIVIWDNKPMSMEYTLTQLSIHLAYHVGQINYHRRMLDV